MVVQCCVCKKVRMEGVWRAADPTSQRPDEMSHGYCPSCADDAFREVREYHRHNFQRYATANVANS